MNSDDLDINFNSVLSAKVGPLVLMENKTIISELHYIMKHIDDDGPFTVTPENHDKLIEALIFAQTYGLIDSTICHWLHVRCEIEKDRFAKEKDYSHIAEDNEKMIAENKRLTWLYYHRTISSLIGVSFIILLMIYLYIEYLK